MSWLGGRDSVPPATSEASCRATPKATEQGTFSVPETIAQAFAASQDR
jgi:hypothetical protein